LVKTIAALALGHSLALSLAVFDVVRVPTAPIELLIALSVFVLAVELAREPGGGSSLLRRRPWPMAFAFGLLHGLGFAEALRAAGLPQSDIPLALLAFNLGIEAAQVAFIAALLVLACTARGLRIGWPRWVAQIPPYVMGSLAACWCLERAAALIL
jgi:hypothetical protein